MRNQVLGNIASFVHGFHSRLRHGFFLSFWVIASLYSNSCQRGNDSANGGQAPQTEDQAKISDMINLVNQLQDSKNLGFLFASSSERDQKAFNDILYDIKLALLRLSENAKDRPALELLQQSAKSLEGLNVLREDKPQVDDLISQINQLVHQLTVSFGLTDGELPWKLFSYSFYDGLSPFTTFSNTAGWKPDVALDIHFAEISGYDVSSWLLSPTFDLSQIQDPRFRIRHAILVDRNTGRYASDEFNRNLILQTAFKAKVSNDYEGGDPALAHWTDVSLAPLPASVDFHTVESPDIDLNPFKGEHVTIAFFYDVNSEVLGHHYITWQVEQFDLLGAGDLPALVKPASKLWEFSFNKSSISPFHSLSLVQGGTKWMAAQIGTPPQYKFVKANAYGMDDSDTWLISPKISLKDITEAKLNIAEVVNSPAWNKMQILVSTNYLGDDPRKSKWKEYKHAPKTQIPEKKWTDVAVNGLDLSAYADQTIVLAFHFTSQKGDVHAWELKTISIDGKGNQIDPQAFNLTFKGRGSQGQTQTKPNNSTNPSNPTNGPKNPTQPIVPSENEFFTKVFASLDGFNQSTIEGQSTSFVINNVGPSARISNFKAKALGTQVLYSNPIDLTAYAKVQIQVKQSLNFYTADAKNQKLIQIQMANADGDTFDPKSAMWTTLEFKTLPAGTNFDPIRSEWLEIPQALLGHKVVIGFRYQSIANQFPSWDLYELHLQGDKK